MHAEPDLEAWMVGRLVVEVPDEAPAVVINRDEVVCAQLRVEQLGKIVGLPIVGEGRWIVPACDRLRVLLPHWPELEQALNRTPSRHATPDAWS
jgi:hypothetical protein